MARWLECGMQSGTPEGRRAVRRLMWAFIGLSVVMVVLMEAAKLAIDGLPEPRGWAAAVITLVPVVPFAAMLVAFARTYRHLDEMVIRVQFEALALTLAFTMIASIGWGQLQKAGLLPLTEMWVVWPLATFIYGGCLFGVMRRYR